MKIGDTVYFKYCSPEYRRACPIKINHIVAVEYQETCDGNLRTGKYWQASEDGIGWYLLTDLQE